MRRQEGLEVWYLTATDTSTGAGLWVHHETVVPAHGEPYAHGWTALFEPDETPVLARFGPERTAPGTADDGTWHRAAGCKIGPGQLCGAADPLRWELTFHDSGPPLYTFPRWAWSSRLLPGAQIVPAPSARVVGTVHVADRAVPIDGAGALARIHGHGNAQRWGWLHADLDGEGVLEIVTATARRPGLRRVPPLALVQLRLAGQPDWPRRPLLAAPRFRTALRSDGFDLSGRHRGRRLDVEVRWAQRQEVELQYRDPDGSTAICRNSEVASANITLTRRGSVRNWSIEDRAHAEVGERP